MADQTFENFDDCKDQFDLTKPNSALSAYVAAYKAYLDAGDCWKTINKLLGTNKKAGTILSCIRQYCTALDHCAGVARDCGYTGMIGVCGITDTDPRRFMPPLPMSGEFYTNDVFAMVPVGQLKPIPLTNPMLRYDLIFANTNYCTKTRKPETPVTTVAQCQALFNGKVPVPRFSTTGKFLGCVIPGLNLNDLTDAVVKGTATINDNIKVVKDSGILTAYLNKQTDVKTRWENCCGICKLNPKDCPKCTENSKLCGDEPGGCPVKLPECLS